MRTGSLTRVSYLRRLAGGGLRVAAQMPPHLPHLPGLPDGEMRTPTRSAPRTGTGVDRAGDRLPAGHPAIVVDGGA